MRYYCANIEVGKPEEFLKAVELGYEIQCVAYPKKKELDFFNFFIKQYCIGVKHLSRTDKNCYISEIVKGTEERAYHRVSKLLVALPEVGNLIGTAKIAEHSININIGLHIGINHSYIDPGADKYNLRGLYRILLTKLLSKAQSKATA